MKILYIHQYFNTPEEGGGTRSYWFSQKLLSKGNQVVMLTMTRSFDKESGRKNRDGIEVIYLNVHYDNSMSKFQKLKSFLKFIIKSTQYALKEKDVDLIFATSTPLSTSFPALICKWVKRTPFIFEVRDLWPEFPIQIGAIKNKFIIYFLRKYEKLVYKKATHIIALSPGMKEGIIKTGILPKKITLIPNMSKPDKFYPREKSEEIAIKYDIDLNKFNIIHFGSMGVANGLNYIIETAIILQEQKVENVCFIFFGRGATEKKIKNKVNKEQLKNVIFHDRVGMSQLSEVVNLCDLSITSFLNLPILQTNSPNKLFDSLSAGIPIVVNSSGWTKDIVEENNCGFFVDPDNPIDFANKILLYKDEASLLSKWGENARKIAIEKYNKDKLSDVFVSTIMNYS